MTSVLVDRRAEKGKSTANRQRVLKRLAGALKAQVDRLIARRKLGEHDQNTEFTIERKDVKEPNFALDPASGVSGRDAICAQLHCRLRGALGRRSRGADT